MRERQDLLGEQNTKATLIEPLLAALGWDMEDVDEVCREYKRKSQDNPVDYALFLLRAPRLFVEAKGIGGSLADRKWISQTLSYATVVGVEWCVLTNGDEYRLYNAHAPVDVEEKLFRSIVISNPQQDFALDTLELLSREKMGENFLNVLWKAHFIDRKVKSALENLFLNDDPGFVKLLRKKTTGLNPSDIRLSLKRANVKIDFPMVPRGELKPQQEPEYQQRRPKRKPNHSTASPERKSPIRHDTTIIDLIRRGAIHAPLQLERKYKGTVLKATLADNGTVDFAGTSYDSLSTAAGMARKSIIGAPQAARTLKLTVGPFGNSAMVLPASWLKWTC